MSTTAPQYLPMRGSALTFTSANEAGSTVRVETADRQTLEYELIGWAVVVTDLEHSEPPVLLRTEVQPVFLAGNGRPAVPEDLLDRIDQRFMWSIVTPLP